LKLRAALALNEKAREALLRLIRDIRIKQAIEAKEAARALMVR
jgi:hypothetical protein